MRRIGLPAIFRSLVELAVGLLAQFAPDRSRRQIAIAACESAMSEMQAMTPAELAEVELWAVRLQCRYKSYLESG